jgi:hypothetical protein
VKCRYGGSLAIFCCVLGVLGMGTSRAGLADARVNALITERSANELRVSFRLVNIFDDQLIERLHSGFALRFEHDVDLIDPRSIFLPTRLVAGIRMQTEVAYDNLTRQYRLFRSLRAKGKWRAASLLELDVTRKTQSLDEAMAWITRIEDVPLPWGENFPEQDRVHLRVRSDLGRRWMLNMIPTRYSVSAELALEF